MYRIYGEHNKNSMPFYSLSYGVELLEGVNLNDYSAPGNYYCSANVTAATLINCPTTSAFTMKVEYSVGTSYPCQTLRVFDTGDIYYRYYDSYNTKSYGAWRVIKTTVVS